MSSSNYMDNVPVKIAENYKPPPRLYQLPQAVINKLALPGNHYEEAPQFVYDFQLERKVLAKIPEWRRMREQEREVRRERREKREQDKLRAMEAKHKQMLGAISYPSTEDLPSSESETEEIDEFKDKEKVAAKQKEEVFKQETKTIISTVANSFHNILQPTILPRHGKNADAATADGSFNNALSGTMIVHKDSTTNAWGGKSAFNYKDFEDDTSSPFDNIELKTINDLDILAQVLHNTQLKAAASDNSEGREQIATVEQQQQVMEQTKDVKQNVENTRGNLVNSNVTKEPCNSEVVENSNIQDAVNLKIIENTKAALEKVNFENIPSIGDTATTKSTLEPVLSNKFIYQTPPSFMTFTNQQQQHHLQQQQQQQLHSYMPYNQVYSNELSSNCQQPQYNSYNLQAQYNNQNYLYAHTNCNGGSSTAAAYFSPTHIVSHNNANTYLSPTQQSYLPAALTKLQAETEVNLKSKSVPDILKELTEEVRNSVMRRSRNYSHNIDDGKEEQQASDEVKSNVLQQAPARTQYYAKLEAPARKLAKNISSMGFPLERVAKIAQIVGADDKKIIEHLIPLSELMDLGFDETKISEALMKFDNNKEKALEFLIS